MEEKFETNVTKIGMYGVPGAGFNVNPASSGVRAAWCCCNLNNGGNAGLPARNSNNSVSNANWNGALGAYIWLNTYVRIYLMRRTFHAYARKLLETSTALK